jgi:hypothetical protein
VWQEEATVHAESRSLARQLSEVRATHQEALTEIASKTHVRGSRLPPPVAVSLMLPLVCAMSQKLRMEKTRGDSLQERAAQLQIRYDELQAVRRPCDAAALCCVWSHVCAPGCRSKG